ncbi:MAG: hypothetical protein LBM87_08560 [Ruminococcus sp.]|jgi:putative MATE family efflux protein|nr:hypothetical protein [Ruminococcus sp.]
MRDLTLGKPFNNILRLAFPLLLCVLVEQSGMIDSFIAGRFLGEAALSAVGNATSVSAVFMLAAYGLNVGGAVVISRLFGAKRVSLLKETIYTLFVSGALLGVIIGIAGIILCKPILLLINTPPEILQISAEFLSIYLCALPAMYIFSISCGVFTALGDSLTPCLFLVGANILNIIMNFFSVWFTDWGVAGIAASKCFAQLICAALIMLMLNFKLRKIFGHSLKTRIMSPAVIKNLAANVVPAMLHSSVVSVGNLLIQAAVNPFGTSFIAGIALGGRINGFASDCIDTVPDAHSAYAAQNIGAGRLERVKHGFGAGVILVLVLSAVFSAAFIFFSDFIIGIFLEDEISAAAVTSAKQYIKTAAAVYPLMGIKYLCDDVLRAAGRMKLYLLMAVNNLTLRVVLVYILLPFIGLNSVFIAWAAAISVSGTISIIIYKKGIWQNKLTKPDIISDNRIPDVVKLCV